MTQNYPIVNNLDFEDYKNQLKTFLKSQPKFRDYDFEGSNMSILLDVLAYNTYQNVFYDNMSINEWFISTAQLENSIYAHAKTLNYLPRSRTSSIAKISFELDVRDRSAFVTIPAKTEFTSDTKTQKFSFFTREDITIFPKNGVYYSDCIDIYEGKFKQDKYFAKSDLNFVYRISSKDVDMSSVSVTVVTNGLSEKYIFAENTLETNENSKVFFAQCTDGFYEIYFGKNIFGTHPVENSIIDIQYAVSSGSKSNGVNSFIAPSKISNYSVKNFKVLSAASGGAQRENIDSIRHYAVKNNQTKWRAISEADYEILLKNKFPEVKAVSVLGGEKLDPPRYGKVAVYVDTVNAEGVSENIKKKLQNYLRDKTPISIEPIIMSPDFVHFRVSVKATVDTKIENMTSNSALRLIRNEIIKYNEEKLNSFGIQLYHSDLENFIKNSSKSFENISVDLRPYIEREIVLNSPNSFDVYFENETLPLADYAIRSLQSKISSHPKIPKLEAERGERYPSVYSSEFLYDNTICYLRDDGFGILDIVRNEGDLDAIVQTNIGTIDYKTGKVSVNNLVISSAINGRTSLKIFLTLKNRNMKIKSNTIATIRKEDISVEIITK